MRVPEFPRRVIGVLSVCAAAAVLAACAPQGQPTPTSVPTSSATVTTTPTPSATADPRVDPEASATDNLPVFAAVIDEVWATPSRAQGRAYIDALVEAGFDKEAMQVTDDLSTVGNPAESIQFSVRWGEECLLGQVGPTTPQPVAIVAPVLPGGACLVGVTRPIDW